MTQRDLFDGERGKREGLDRVEANAGDFLAVMRRHAAHVCRTRGSVTSDDLRRYAARLGIEPHHPNAWGAVFRGKEWRKVGYRKSTLPSNHAREVRVWVRG